MKIHSGSQETGRVFVVTAKPLLCHAHNIDIREGKNKTW